MDIQNYESGQYEDRYEYRAFVPTSVCRNWGNLDGELTELLGRADRALGELNAFTRLVPDIDLLIRMHVAKEATQSNRIEGTRTDIEDTFKTAGDLAPEERNDWTDVRNCIRATDFAIEALTGLPLSNRLLRETHAVLMAGAHNEHKRPGEFRTSQNWIGVSLKNATFVPPHHDRVSDLMGDLEKFLHADDLRVHPLLRIAIGHYQFETIHPFLDGNGRLGRLMISLFLTSEGLLDKPALCLSDYFERNKTAYIDHLTAMREGNHLRRWLIFFLHGVEETARASADAFVETLKLKERIDAKVLPRFGVRRRDNARTLMRHLHAHPAVNVKTVTELIAGTTNTASALISDLVDHGVLTEITGGRRNRLFVFRDYVSLFKR